MSFPHWAMACEGIPKETPGTSGVLVPGADAFRNPRTIGRSGCTPAEPYPPNRKTMVDQTSSILNLGLTNHIPVIRGQALRLLRVFTAIHLCGIRRISRRFPLAW